jgi:hypothetical protein
MFWLGLVTSDLTFKKIPWTRFEADTKSRRQYYIGCIGTDTQNISFTVWTASEYTSLFQWAKCLDALLEGAPRVCLFLDSTRSQRPNGMGIDTCLIGTNCGENVEFAHVSLHKKIFGFREEDLAEAYNKDRAIGHGLFITFDAFFPCTPSIHGDLLPDIPPYPGQPRLVARKEDIKAFFNQNCLHMYPGRQPEDPTWYPLCSREELDASLKRK